MSTHWTMRVSPQDKKMIAYVAKHYRCKQSQFIKAMVREIYATKIAEQENKIRQLSPA